MRGEVGGIRRYRQITPTSPLTPEQNASRQSPDPQTQQQQLAAEEAIIREMKDRDYRDRNRAESPLKPASDAIILDSTSMTLEQVLSRSEQIVLSHLSA